MQCCSTARSTRLAAAGGPRCLPFSTSSRRAAFSSCSSSSVSRRGFVAPQQSAAAAGASQQPSSSSRRSRQLAVTCRAADDRPTAGSSSSAAGFKFNPVYLVITGAYAGLLVFKNPYIYAVLTILTILPQNSNVTSLNNLVLLFYESGIFTNFGEAVNCVRLVTWLSMGFMVLSFALAA